MKIFPLRCAFILGTLTFFAVLSSGFSHDANGSQSEESDPETIYSVSHVKLHKETEYAATLANAWAIYRRLDLVLPKPHIVLKGIDDSGKPYFVEIFTWRRSSIPDNAPKEVREVWKQLGILCEERGGRPPIDFSDGGVTIIGLE